MPPVGGAGPRIAAQVRLLLGRGNLGRVLWVEADGDDFEVLPWVQADRFQTAYDAVEDLRAQHRAAVIDGREDDGLAGLEETAERDGAAEFVLEGEIERNRLVEFLIDADTGQTGGKC